MSPIVPPPFPRPDVSGPWQGGGMGEERLRELHWLSLVKKWHLIVVHNFLK